MALLEAPAWKDRELSFGGAPVADYAWSPDSTVLAVVLGEGSSQPKSLGGVRVPPTPSSPATGASSGNAGNAGSPALTEPERLTTIDATVGIHSKLAWFGNGRFVAFHGPDEGDEYVHFSELGASGFYSDVALMDFVSFGPSVHLIPTDDGFWSVDPKNGVYFWSVPSPSRKVSGADVWAYAHAFAKPTDPILAAADLVLSPSARLVGRKWPTNAPVDFRIYRPKDEDVESPVKTAQACPTFLAWASKLERLACVADTQTAGAVRIFDIDNSDLPFLNGREIVNNEYVYLENDAYPRRRAFSERGEWFAFTSTSEIHVADVAAGRVIPQSDLTGATDKVDFSFSTNEFWLVIQRESSLIIRSLDYRNSSPYVIASNANIKNLLDCTPVYMDNPDTWCGRPGHTPQLPWSSDSRWLAYLSDVGSLHVLDTSFMPARRVTLVNDETETSCRQPEFQP